MESLTNSSNKLWFTSIKMFFEQRNFTQHHTNSLSAMKGDTEAWNYSKVGCLLTLNGGTAPVLIQCCTDAWHYTNVGCLPALALLTGYNRNGIAPVVRIGSTPIFPPGWLLPSLCSGIKLHTRKINFFFPSCTMY